MCELCNLEKKTEWLYEDSYFVVCYCETCKVPMIVLKRHDLNLTQTELIDLMWIFKTLDLHEFKKLDQNRKKIKDHWHCHIR